MPLIISLLLLLLLSRILGEVASRFGQPSMIGEIAAGILLGPSCLGYIKYDPEIKAIADIGVLLLVFLAGMEMDMDALWKSCRGSGAWVSASAFLAPLLLGAATGYAFGMDYTRVAFVGLCIAITALPVSVRILMDLGRLNTDIGQKIVSAAVVNDVVALLVLGIIVDMKSSGAGIERLLQVLATSLAKALLLMSVVAISARLIRRYSPKRFIRSAGAFEKLLDRLKGNEARFAIVLLFVMAFASFSQALGLDFVVGAFFGSMLLSHEALGRRNFATIQNTASSVTMGFLGPVFFAAIGLEFNAYALRNWMLVTAILIVSFAGKILGGYAGGRLAGLRNTESWALGMGLNGRGVMELVIANIAFSRGFIGQGLFTTLVLMALTTTFATPILLRATFKRVDNLQAQAVKIA